ncbi:hypothetical protein ISF6_2592 [Piscinibacter sakaiensis]|uniref:Calcineurin-like phosphoesterase domain-containing protein n=2 Tax=Piscinibacter sakaiensis TaxID=1547922 RepID=A0A0K8P254_PISS1|nr:hypothetical protein ISF6_2592 [Piscinibacter sakaiensis]
MPPGEALADAPGRRCPLHYRTRPAAFAVEAPAHLQGLEVLYVVGGLYGNELALDRVLDLFDAERGRKRLVFNGDFHWFDVDPGRFARVQQAVLRHEALRGNVETELADPDAAAGAGCGCAYPDWVGDGVVERSNRILERLRGATTPDQRAALGALPMGLRADVGALRVGIVHGDPTSLAGWGFAQEHLREAAHRRRVAGWFDEAQVDAFACSHTCLPVFQAIAARPGGGPRWVLNNGAAGMPNVSGDLAGLLTRVSVRPFDGPARRFGTVAGGVHLDGLAIDFDPRAWMARFRRDWPPGSDAHVSYAERIARGPAYDAAEIVRADG